MDGAHSASPNALKPLPKSRFESTFWSKWWCISDRTCNPGQNVCARSEPRPKSRLIFALGGKHQGRELADQPRRNQLLDLPKHTPTEPRMLEGFHLPGCSDTDVASASTAPEANDVREAFPIAALPTATSNKSVLTCENKSSLIGACANGHREFDVPELPFGTSFPCACSSALGPRCVALPLCSSYAHGEPSVDDRGRPHK